MDQRWEVPTVSLAANLLMKLASPTAGTQEGEREGASALLAVPTD